MAGVVEQYKWVVPFKLMRIKDADTQEGVALLDTQLPIPILNLFADIKLPLPVVVRLEGIDAWEDETPEGKIALQYTEAWFASRSPEEGFILYLATDGRRDSFGRLLGDIRTSPSHLTGLAWDLLRLGHAKPYTRRQHGTW